MPVELPHGRPVILIRQDSYERSGILRQALDERYQLTPDEFTVEPGLVSIGPLPSDDMLSDLIGQLEESGLVYYQDFFDMSGNWPDWLLLYARAKSGRKS
jgi:hypothetical protein